MKIFRMAVSRFVVSVVLMLACMPQFVGAQDASSFPGMTITPAKTSNMMTKSVSCVDHQWAVIGHPCCQRCHHGVCCPFMTAQETKIGYWEPSEIIEVSCRNGFSMLAPGIAGRGDARPQSCVGANKPGGGRWFFEARVWAINGKDGGLRHQAMGGTKGEQVRQCTMETGDGTNDLPWPPYSSGHTEGYGVKITKFSKGATNGPAGSWEAYISDKDKSWADDSGGAAAPTQKECKIGGVDLANCWGPLGNTGWVSHPNPKIAAALVAWRAHLKAKAAGKVSPPGNGGYKMAMEYPFVKYSGAFGGTMGAPNGGKEGSACFQPGDSGPDWFGGMKPEDIPGFVKGMKPGDVSTVAEANPGIYIFTIWVHTSCIRYSGMLFPTARCHYVGID